MQSQANHLEVQQGLWTYHSVRNDRGILLVILLLATFLRLSGLNEPGLWLDEAAYTIAAQKPIISQVTKPIETLQTSIGSADPVLSAIPFSLSLKLGFSNYLARFPAALFGILSVAVIYRLGQALFGNVVGLIAALLLCTSSFHILYSQEARSYSQLLFFSITSFWFFYRAIIDNKLMYWALYTLFTWAGMSSNYLMAFVISVQGVFLVIVFIQTIFSESHKIANNRAALVRVWKSFLLSLFAIFLMRLPWLWSFIFWLDKTVGGPYTLDLVGDFTQSIRALTSNNSLIFSVFLALYLLGLALALYYSPKRGILLACWLIVPIPITIVGLWFVSQFFHPRYVISSLPALLLAAASGLVGVSNFIQRILFPSRSKLPLKRTIKFSQSASIGLVAVLISIPGLLNPTTKQGWPQGQLQAAASYIFTSAHSGEGVIGVPNAQYLKLYIQPTRQDLIYLDAGSTTLPTTLAGRWYVFYDAQNIPERWQNQLTYKDFYDILVVYQPGACNIENCINETKILFSEIAQANPGSIIEKRTNAMLSGLTKLPIN